MRQTRSQLRAFTLIELILVMVIISIALGYAAPSLRGWGQGQKLKNAADEFIAATGVARSLAVSEATIYAVEINSGDNTYAVKQIDAATGVKTDAAGSMGGIKSLPETFKITLVSGGGSTAEGTAAAAAGSNVILFYPDARSTPAVVQIESPAGEVIKIQSESPAEPFRKAENAS